MGKSSHESSPHGRRAGKKGRSTRVQMTLNDAKSRLQLKQPALGFVTDDTEIDFSDAPELTDTQLKRMTRVGPGRPPLGEEPRKMISIKLDTKLLSKLKAEAKKDRKPYQSLIHEILQKHVRKKAA